jgi:hypothetical protein
VNQLEAHPVGQAPEICVVDMARKCIVRVVLSKEQREILDELARRLGTSESETLRMAFMDYAKELSMMKESIHRVKNQG